MTSKSKKEFYGPFRSKETYDLVGWSDSKFKDIGSVLESLDGSTSEAVYNDLEGIYGEESIKSVLESSDESVSEAVYNDLEGIYGEESTEEEEIDTDHLDDIPDGAGCVVVWEETSDRRRGAQD